MKVINTGEPIKIPVGKNILGRILNVIGEPVDNAGAIETDTYLPIHRPSPQLTDQNTNVEILETLLRHEMEVYNFAKKSKSQHFNFTLIFVFLMATNTKKCKKWGT